MENTQLTLNISDPKAAYLYGLGLAIKVAVYEGEKYINLSGPRFEQNRKTIEDLHKKALEVLENHE